MRSLAQSVLKIGLWTAFSLVIISHAASAKIKIIRSSVPGLEANMALSETEIIDVPKDAVVVVLQTPECRALEIKGAYRGTIADYLQQRRGFWERAQSLWDRLTGNGGNQSGAPTGATRGLGSKNECG